MLLNYISKLIINEVRPMHRVFIYGFLFLLLSSFFYPQQTIFIEEGKTPIPQASADKVWVDSVMNTLSIEEQIGQLIMVAAYSNKGAAHVKEIEALVKDQKIGGLIFFQGGPVRQANLTNKYQGLADIPLMIAMDAEWGLDMRLDSTFRFPWMMTQGAVQNDSLVYQMGAELAMHCRRLGVHINFAPVVDINTNPKNPIINSRSFGENKKEVTRRGVAYMNGLQDNKVLACAKHFPGHGDTDSDSHKTLPQLNHNRKRLDDIELYPFRELMDKGLGSVMVAHLDIPELEKAANTPSSLSYTVIHDLLQEEIGFEGLIFTDALNMSGVTKNNLPGEIEVKALLAGNDVLLFPQDVPIALSKVKEAVANGVISDSLISYKCRKVLKTKYWLGLNNYQPIDKENLVKDLNPPSSELVNRALIKESITVLKDREKLLPVRKLNDYSIAAISLGDDDGAAFREALDWYSLVDSYVYDEKKVDDILEDLSLYDLVIVGVHKSNKSPWKKYNISDETKDFVRRLSLQNQFVLDIFANPYSLSEFKEAELADALVVSYQNSELAQQISAQMIFGAFGSEGRLPVTVSDLFRAGDGINTPSLNRFEYTQPESVGIDANMLAEIDKIALQAINDKATPGCQILVAKKGEIIYNKSFGYHTYDKKQAVKNTDLYDLASITKIAATVPSLMKLVDEEKFDVDKKLGDYLPGAKMTNKENINIRELLAHQGQLQAWIPFYKYTLDKSGKPSSKLYSNKRTMLYSYKVAPDLYINRFYRDSILDRIYKSELRDKKDYLYSDLGYYMLQDIVEYESETKLDKFVQQNFYEPLGAHRMLYNPLSKFSKRDIVPTENDKYFRHQLIQGYVHDPGAAMLGGVAGHAGVFANANDLAKLMQMYMQKGEYGGLRYIDSAVVNEFTRCQYCDNENRRGIGFDKPQLQESGPTCGCVSYLSFGHTGFTGTISWVDPEEEIVYIFLSNRVYPDAENRKLITGNYRTRIQQVIYDSLHSYPSNL